MQRHNKP